MSISNNLPDILREMRRKKGWNQGQIAEQLGVSRQAYAYYESGQRNPSFETIKKIAELHKVTVDQLIDDEANYDETKKRPARSATASILLDAIELNDDDAIEVLQRLLVHNGEQLTEDQVREILTIARYQLAKNQK